MSLKAKLEAVIYAAEEPITLAQLASLFAAEALEHQAALKAEQQAEEAANAPETTEPLPLLAEEATEAEPTPESVSEAGPTPDLGAPSTSALSAEVGGTAPTPAAEAIDPADAAKQAARQRDREVRAILRAILDELLADYEADGRGIEIREIAGGYRMATKPSSHDAVRLFVKSLKPPLKLSLPALETLAVIAYKQPVTAPEVSEIRGVESGGVLGSLMARKLIATAGRKQVIGRPILYKTTKEFLLRFGLKDLNELPSMEEFEKMAAVEIDDMEPDTAAEIAPSPAPALAEDETQASENASHSLEPGQEAETEAYDAPQESKQESSAEDGSREEDGSKESPVEESRSEEGSGQEGNSEDSGKDSPEAEEIR